MPLYMDVHMVPGVKARDVAEAHRLDMMHQGECSCTCMTYWIDEERGNIFCLVEAPSPEAVSKMHDKAHGLIPNKIIEVSGDLVSSFLGRIYDPSDAIVTVDDLKVFSDSAYRFLLLTHTADPALLRNSLGQDAAEELLLRHNGIIRKHAKEAGGREVEHERTGFILSFASASKALACAGGIQKELPSADVHTLGFRMAVHSGEPVENSKNMFGDTIKFGCWMCNITKEGQISVSSPVKERASKDYFDHRQKLFFTLSPQDETLLEALFSRLEENWQDPDFNVEDYCQEMAMSKSQLYRKSILLTGLSPNVLLKEFRLDQAKAMMRKRRYSISQITFDSGFTSPSYFTKCFKKKFGLLPMAYLELLH